MSDVRALLKAKREEQRIVHPLASYSQSGALRCIVCGTLIKYASAWNGHLGSKLHRTNTARLREEEKLKEEKMEGKRKADEAMNEPAKKRSVDAEDIQQVSPLPPDSDTRLPAEFFSDPSRTLDLTEVDSDEGVDNPPRIGTNTQSQTTLDLEWAAFQEAVINPPGEIHTQETFERATIFAAPQLSTEIPEGFPSSVAREVELEREASPKPKDEETDWRRRAEEEKELIMDRLLDEERAQEEADERVTVLKAKLELLKQKRMAVKAKKATR